MQAVSPHDDDRPKGDGRVLRGERNTQGVLDALLTFYRKGNPTPTIMQVAQLAGMTTRAVYHRFPGLDAIARELAKREYAQHRMRHLGELPRHESLEQRIASLMEQRAGMFEAMKPVRMATVATLHRSPELQQQVRLLASQARADVERIFARELDTLPAGERKNALESLDLLASIDSWDRLRSRQQLSIEEAKAVTCDLLRRVLAPLASP
jgi:TetR/AcrR family transcriptional regulator, regulator of autoinduction and epiphytic fitness